MCGKRLNAWKTIPIFFRRALTSIFAVRQALAVDDDLALLDVLEPVEAAQERRLAGAGRADQADDVVLLDVEVDLVQNLQCAEPLRDAAEVDEGRCAVAVACSKRLGAFAALALSDEIVRESRERDGDQDEEDRCDEERRKVAVRVRELL